AEMAPGPGEKEIAQEAAKNASQVEKDMKDQPVVLGSGEIIRLIFLKGRRAVRLCSCWGRYGGEFARLVSLPGGLRLRVGQRRLPDVRCLPSVVLRHGVLRGRRYRFYEGHLSAAD